MIIEDFVESCRKLIAPFSDPVLTEFGSYIAERIRFVRFQNSLRVLQRAKELLTDAGIEPTVVNPKILVSILENSGLEDDEELVDKWSRLLASAASGGQILPSFTHILAELSPDEARLLDLVAIHSKALEHRADNAEGVSAKAVREKSRLSPSDFELRMLNLERLGLIRLLATSTHGFSHYLDDSDLILLGPTTLGAALVKACAFR